MRWQLLQIADSAFPTGGFAHSGGLEAAIAHGRARSPEDLDAYLREHLWNVGQASLPFAGAAFDAPERVWPLDAWIDATLVNHVANRASRTQGRTFLATCGRIFGEPGVQALAARARERGDGHPAPTVHFAPVFGASAGMLGLERGEALALFLFLALRGAASAAVRLGVTGPHEAQRMQRRHAATLDAVLAECAALEPGEAAATSPLLDTMGATHDRLYARLFQS